MLIQRKLTLNCLRQSARYFFTSESDPGTNLRERWLRCLNGFVSTTFSVAVVRSPVKLPWLTICRINLKTLVYSFTHLFKADCEGSYQNLYLSLSTNRSRWNLSSVLNKIWEKRSQTYPCMLSAKQQGIWYHFLVWRGWGSNPQPPAHGVNALPLSHSYG